MTPRVTAKQKVAIIALISLGFAGLIGAHGVEAVAPQPGGAPNMVMPLVLAACGTLCFIAAGLQARNLMR
jgi:hypothetical protein